MMSPISKINDQIVGFAFVNDTDLVCFHQGNLCLTDEIMQNIPDGIDHWEGGLKLTRGNIVPEKCWIYALDFGFDNSEKWYYKKAEEIQQQFSILDHNGQRY